MPYLGSSAWYVFPKNIAFSDATGTGSGDPRSYRYGYGVLDENLNFIADADEKRVYFEISDYSNIVFFESPR